jgi:predicted transcriptional regulator
MSVYRRHKRTDFSVIDNHVFKDKELTLKAKGLLATILSLPEDWKYSIEGLASLSNDGTTSVTSALNELIQRGYIIRSQSNDEYGRFNGYIYDIYEKPQEPCSENPITDDTITENQQVLNTNISNTNIVNTNSIDKPLISPTEKRKMLFKEFWDAYPKCKRKVDYDGCEKAFIKIKDLENIFPDIMASLEVWKKDWSKDNFEYVPTTHKWITKKYWEVKDTRTELQQKIDEATQQNISGFLF